VNTRISRMTDLRVLFYLAQLSDLQMRLKRLL